MTRARASAEKPELMCTTVPPAKSRAPIWAIQPPAQTHAAQSKVVQAAYDSRYVRAKGQAVAEQNPLYAGQSKSQEGQAYHRYDRLAPDQTTVEQTYARRHEHDHGC